MTATPTGTPTDTLAEIHFPTIDDLIEFPQPGDVQIAPDGRHVVYGVRTPDWDENRTVQQLWIVPVDGDGSPRQLTFATQSSRSPRWSPDGQWLAFVSKRNGDEHYQIYRMSPFGGEAERLTELKSSASQIAWSPDGGSIAFVLPDPQGDAEKQRAERYGDVHVEDEDDTFSHLWLLRLADKSLHKLTGGKAFHVTDFAWRPEQEAGGAQIAFTTWPSPRIADREETQIWLLDLPSGALHSLTERGGSSPQWSPDGSQLVFQQKDQPTFYINNRLCVATLEDAEEGPTLTNARSVSDDFDEVAYLQRWGRNGIYFFAMQPTALHLFRLEPESSKIECVTRLEGNDAGDGDWLGGGCSFSADFSQVALVGADSQHCNEVMVLALDPQDAASERVKRLTRFNEQLQSWRLAPHEVIEWRSSDGTVIDGILTKPLDFDPQQQYPLLVVIHGGPSGVSTPARLSRYERNYYPIQQWAAKGALILQPNYRGSGGYGEAFRSLNVRNLGVGDAWDVLSGVDALIERGWVSSDRIGVMGWSQGGYITSFLSASSDRFRAASMGAGISNWVTYYVNTDIHPFTRHYLGATPWDDKEIYEKTSPMTYIKNAQTPTLIQHGELDRRVPIPNAYEMYQGLQDVGVETRLVVYKGQPHGIIKPRLNRHVMQDNLDWFDRWIWGEEPAQAESRTWYVAPAGNADLLVRVQQAAQRDGAGFLLFAGSEGLVESPTPQEMLPLALDAEDAAAVVQRVVQQLRENSWHTLVYFARPNQEDAQMQMYQGCLLLAAGIAGDVELKRREEK